MTGRTRIAVFISGGGSNLQALIDASKVGILCGDVVFVVSNMRKAFGLTRAAEAGIETFVYKEKKYDSPQVASENLLARLQKHRIDYIALAGYLRLLPDNVVQAFSGRIVNIHPALLPKYGGKGMYGHHVHEAVLTSGDSESGITIHLVDGIYDHGSVLKQVRVPVLSDDTPDSLAERVLEQEHKWYARVLDRLIKDENEKHN